MNNQEQGYAAPEMQYGDRRPINSDPREQSQWQAVPPIAMVPAPRRGHTRWYWFGVSALILVVIIGGLTITALLLSRTITETKHFTVGDQPTLVLTNSDGSVHLVSGAARQITVVAHKHTFAGNEDQLQVDYKQSSDGNTVTVSANQGSGFSFDFGLFWRVGVDFDVTVPSQTTLNVETSNGSVDASGITGAITILSSNGSVSTNGGSGQVTLTTSNGSIQADNVSGQIALTTSNGSIQADNDTGTLRLKTENGSITVSGTNASGDSTFETSNGSINFSGSLDTSGSYRFHTSNGSIDLTLPANANFQVSSSTSNGSVSSDFNGTTNGAYGNPPYAIITLETSNGSISIHKA